MLRTKLLSAGALGVALGAAALVGLPRRAAPLAPSPAALAPAPSLGGSGPEEASAPDATPLPPPSEEPYFPFLDDEPSDASVSVGNVTHGLLVNGKPLPSLASFGLLAAHVGRDLSYGTSEMVGLLEHAANELYARTGTRLWIGNVARRTGGDIPFSVSHNSGRDADLALSYLDLKGRPVDPPDLVPLDARGLAKGAGLRFDVARTWTVVRALLEYEGAEVQYLFLSAPLGKKLLAYAGAKREPVAVVARAATVLRQPAGAPSHNDHLHVRIYCGRRDVEGGCVDAAPFHAWAHRHEDARAERIDKAVARLDDALAEQRLRAIERLVLLDARDRAGAVAARLSDDDDRIRETAANALGALRDAATAPALVARFDDEPHLGTRVAILRALGAVGGAAAEGALATVIAREAPRPAFLSAAGEGLPDFVSAADEASTPPADGFGRALHVVDTPALEVMAERAALRLVAVDAAGGSEALELVAPLSELLDHDDPELRGRAAEALALLTNRSFDGAWDDPTAGRAKRDKAIAAWRRWNAQLGRRPREAWLASGFLAAGYRVPRLEAKHAWELVRAVARGGHLGHNAQRALARITGEPVPAGLSDRAACGRWLGWLRSHRRQFRLEPPSPALRALCR